MNTKEVAKITGVSVRTLHHYDDIGLLCPKRNHENNYRDYSDDDLDKLQQILIFRECGFPLDRIRQMINDTSFDVIRALETQRKYLKHEKKRIDMMLQTLKTTIQYKKGETDMSREEKFKGFDLRANPYEDEARKLWGDQAVDDSSAYLNKKTDRELAGISKGMGDIFHACAALTDEKPEAAKVQDLMGTFYTFLNTHFGHYYSYEAFAGLGQLYITDERFTKNIDRFGEGLSVFLAKAMAVYAEANKGE